MWTGVIAAVHSLKGRAASEAILSNALREYAEGLESSGICIRIPEWWRWSWCCCYQGSFRQDIVSVTHFCQRCIPSIEIWWSRYWNLCYGTASQTSFEFWAAWSRLSINFSVDWLFVSSRCLWILQGDHITLHYLHVSLDLNFNSPSFQACIASCWYYSTWMI